MALPTGEELIEKYRATGATPNANVYEDTYNCACALGVSLRAAGLKIDCYEAVIQAAALFGEPYETVQQYENGVTDCEWECEDALGLGCPDLQDGAYKAGWDAWRRVRQEFPLRD